MITKVATRRGAPGRQPDADRAAFLAFVDALEGPANAARAEAQWRLEKGLPPEAVVSHLVAAWPEEERRRRRRAWLAPLRDHSYLIGVFPPLVYCALRLLGGTAAARTLITDPEAYHVFCYLVAVPLTFTPLLLIGHPGRRQRGLMRVLLTTRHPSLVPLYLDALALVPSRQDRHTLAALLAELLPAYADGDTPSLDEHQQRVLLAEIRRRIRRTKRAHRLRDRDGRFLTAALYALESETARSGWPQGENRLLTETVAAARAVGSRGVAQAAEDCLLRLEVAGGNGGRG